MKPITPQELDATLGSDIPDVIIEVVNEMLKKEYRGRSVTLLQKDIIREVIERDCSLTSTKIYENGWLDFEPLFEKAGWKVTYGKPAYCESYEASFEFTPKRKHTMPL